jgi:hypothetical protein
VIDESENDEVDEIAPAREPELTEDERAMRS